MTRKSLVELTEEELIEVFQGLAKNRGSAVMCGDVRKANRIYGKFDAVDKELRARGPEARRRLVPLLDHEDLSIRYYTAVRLLAVEPSRARAVLEDVHARGPFELAGDAAGTLRMLDAGTFKPD